MKSVLTAAEAWGAKLRHDGSVSAIVAGLVAMLTGYTSTFALMVQAGHAAGLSSLMIGSWLGSLALAMGVATLGLSLHYRAPIVIVWSTPGAALLVTSLGSVPYGEAIGGFMVAALMVLTVGLSGRFDQLIRFLPGSIAAALLAGILFQLGIGIFKAAQASPALVLPLFVLYLLLRRLWPRYAVPLVLLGGIALSMGLKIAHPPITGLEMIHPIWVNPMFSINGLINIALPLFVVAMASQNLPGLAVLRADGYTVPASPLISVTGVGSLLIAGFGGHGINLAAITAAICTGPEAHPDPRRRYVAALTCGVGNLLAGLVAVSIAALLTALPSALIATIAGLALLGSIGSGLTTALGNVQERDAALITFLVTASGMTLGGIGAAFWGVVAGMLTLFIQRSRR